VGDIDADASEPSGPTPAISSDEPSIAAAPGLAPTDVAETVPVAEEHAADDAPESSAEPELVRRSVSQEIAHRLYAAGARFCFTVPGESLLPLIDDFTAVGIRVVTTRHEGGAAFMAEALAQSTGKPHIVAVTRTVGAANASIGIHTAQQDSAPVVAVVGQVSRPFMGREAFQESDLVGGIGSLA
jgi:acetolactate synthase I/II/III large subunit